MSHFRPCVTFSLRNKRPTTCDPNGHIAEKSLCEHVHKYPFVAQSVKMSSFHNPVIALHTVIAAICAMSERVLLIHSLTGGRVFFKKVMVCVKNNHEMHTFSPYFVPVQLSSTCFEQIIVHCLKHIEDSLIGTN
jgi:hypothetical protein